MLIIGISGQTGAGKSTTANILSKMGFGENLEVDAVGHELLADKETKQKLVSEFGHEILDSNNSVDRKVLGRKAFSDKGSIQKINDIMHPAMVKKISTYINDCLQMGKKSIIINAALLFTMHLDSLCNRLIYVQSDSEVRLKRLVRYRNLPKAIAEERLFSQDKLPNESKNIIIIENNGNEVELEKKVKNISKLLIL